MFVESQRRGRTRSVLELEVEKTMSSHAADIVDLSEVITGLWDQGKVEPPFYPRPKGRFHPRDHNFLCISPYTSTCNTTLNGDTRYVGHGLATPE
jgi:hypothetical protein